MRCWVQAETPFAIVLVHFVLIQNEPKDQGGRKKTILPTDRHPARSEHGDAGSPWMWIGTIQRSFVMYPKRGGEIPVLHLRFATA